MISLEILDVKSFMGKLLIQSVFDSFLVKEADITTFISFHMDGKLHKGFYNTEEQEMLEERELGKWSELKPFAYQMIKGTKTPLAFHIVFQLTKSQVLQVVKNAGLAIRPEDITGLYMNIRYDQGVLYVVTGSGQKTFTLDKSLDIAWDEQVKRFLKQQEIACQS